MKKFLIFIFVVAILIVLFFIISPSETNGPAINQENSTVEDGADVAQDGEVIDDELPPATSPDPAMEDKIHEVRITSSGFVPKNLTVKKGDMVVWINDDARASWPASDIHPSHGVYPESGGCIGSAFDACKGLEQGEEYGFIFDRVGSWGVHDHLRPSFRGTVVVEE